MTLATDEVLRHGPKALARAGFVAVERLAAEKEHSLGAQMLTRLAIIVSVRESPLMLRLWRSISRRHK